MARALAGRPPQRREEVRADYDAALAAMGLTDPDADAVLAGAGDDQADENGLIEVWPEHETPLLILRAMNTQWRAVMGSLIGLDYNVLPFVAKQLRIGRRALREAFPVLQAMEQQVLVCTAEQASKG